MEIRQNIVKKLNSLYNFVLDHEVFDHITTLVFGKTTRQLKDEKIKQLAEQTKREIEESNNLLLDTLVSDYESESQRIVARQILENELRYISTEQASGVNNMDNKKSWLMAIAAKVVKQLMVFDDIVGIQPMQGPVGLVYRVELKHASDEKTKDSEEDDLFSQTVRIEIVSRAVEAASRRLHARWTIEVARDLGCHNIDIEAEFVAIISQEIVYELTNELIGDLVKLAEQNPASRKVTTRPSNNIPPTSLSDQARIMMLNLTKLSNSIARSTRRGCGNKIITTPEGVALLQSNKDIKFVPVKIDKFVGACSTILVGYITNSSSSFAEPQNPEHYQYTVYSSLSPSLQSDNDEVKFLVAYKGQSATDTGYIYAPYVPVMTSGVLIDELTFQPCISLMTRHGKKFDVEGNSNSINYYGLLTVDTTINCE